MTEPLNAVEIYPKIFVYKGLFKDIDKTYSLLKESEGNNNSIENVTKIVLFCYWVNMPRGSRNASTKLHYLKLTFT